MVDRVCCILGFKRQRHDDFEFFNINIDQTDIS